MISHDYLKKSLRECKIGIWSKNDTRLGSQTNERVQLIEFDGCVCLQSNGRGKATETQWQFSFFIEISGRKLNQ
jgi:hypothetical protein